MELKILKLICDKINTKFNNELTDIGQRIQKELLKELKEYKMNQIESAYEFTEEVVKSDMWISLLTGLAFPEVNSKIIEEPKTEYYNYLIDSSIDITKLEEYKPDIHCKFDYEKDEYYEGFLAAMWGKPEGECPHEPSGHERMLTIEDECYDAWMSGHMDGCEYLENERKKGNIK